MWCCNSKLPRLLINTCVHTVSHDRITLTGTSRLFAFSNLTSNVLLSRSPKTLQVPSGEISPFLVSQIISFLRKLIQTLVTLIYHNPLMTMLFELLLLWAYIIPVGHSLLHSHLVSSLTFSLLSHLDADFYGKRDIRKKGIYDM